MSLKSKIIFGGYGAILALSCVYNAWVPDKPAVTFSNANNNLTLTLNKPAAKELALDAGTQFAKFSLYFFAGFGTSKMLPIIANKLNNRRTERNIRHLENCLMARVQEKS
jgi:hypothetical protein